MDLIDLYNDMDNLQAYFQFKGKDALIMDAKHGDWCYSYNPLMDTPSIECGFRQAYTYGSAYFPCTNKHNALQPPAGNIPAAFTAFFNPSFIGAGPLKGGAAGCERINTAHVWIWNRLSDPALWRVKLRRRIQPIPDYQFDPVPDPLGAPEAYPYARRPPRRVPRNVTPAVQYTLRPNNRKHPRTGPDYVFHRFEPPPPRTRERKWRIADNRLLAGVATLYGGFTELEDFLDAMAQGLPEPLRKAYFRNRTLQDKGNYLVDHMDKVDVKKGVDAWLQDRAQDRAMGKLGKKAAEAAADTGYWVSPRGPGISRPGWSGPHQSMEDE